MLRMKWMTVLVGVLLVSPVAKAENIDLSTVPPRDAVQLTIYNNEDLTLVRERRTITVSEGENPLQFSWANTLIDPTSVELSFRTRQDELRIVDTRFPHDRPEVLYWNVHSEFSGEIQVQITYFTSGISWDADYVLIADEDESAGSLRGYVTVRNDSGEDYADASVRLVVGEVNLVEKIRELAERGIVDRRYRDVEEVEDVPAPVRRDVMMEALAVRPEPPDVRREELSEYYLFTIEGEQTVPHGWSKRMAMFEPARPELELVYRYDQRMHGDRLVRLYRFVNDEASSLGDAPLPDGTVRVFGSHSQGSLTYQAEQDIRYIPIGDQVELNLGEDPRVTLERRTLRSFRDEIWFRVGEEDRFRPLGDGQERIERNDRVAGWNTRRIFQERIHNTRQHPVQVEIRRRFEGDATFRSEVEAQSHDRRTVQMQLEAPARQRVELMYETITREGHNREQDRLVIEEGEPSTVPWMD